jgi:tetratricopeptide (TPR) repeat protein
MPANHQSRTRTQRSHLAQFHSRRTSFHCLKVSLRRGVALAIAFGVVSYQGAMFAQYQPIQYQTNQYQSPQPSAATARDARFGGGEIPASPWSARENGQSNLNRDFQALEPQRPVRQPGRDYRNSSTAEPATNVSLELGSQSNADRPAPVTLMGPVTSSNMNVDKQGPKGLRVSNRASLFINKSPDLAASVASPSVSTVVAPIEFPAEFPGTNSSTEESRLNVAPHRKALTQNASVRGQPDGPGGDAGGIILGDPLPSVSQQTKAEGQAMASAGSGLQSLPARDLQPEVRETALAQTVSAKTSSARTETRLDLSDSAANTNPTSNANPTSSQADVRDETSVLRASLAQRVSYELLSSPPYPASRAPESLEVPTGWGAIEQELKGHLERCDALLKRNAIMSARSEATTGLRRLCNAMDAHRRVLQSGPALEKAFIALREDADFQNLVGGGTFDSISSLVGSHSTEALKGRVLDGVSSEIASQHYRTYARYQFVLAADGHRWAAELLYAYGKTLEKEAELELEKSFRLRSQSVACYQAAIQISPSQSEAASQLGYVLINLDRMDEAQRALMVSLQHRPTASAWSNMAELHRRLGAHADAEYAIQQATAIAEMRPSYTAEKPEITEVDSATFAKYSPIAPQMQTASASATAPASSSGARTASSSSFFSKIFTK